MSEGVRWSNARDCPRKAVYAATLAIPDRDWDDREQRALMRGQSVERDVADMIERQHGAGNIIRQKPVAWPGGVMHGDVFIIDKRLPVEILSSRDPGRPLVESKLLQLAGQVHYDEDAGDRGLLLVVDPVDYQEERIPLELDDEWRTRVEAVTDAVMRGLRGEGLPDRVCRRPSHAIGHFCRYATTCFEGWQPPPAVELEADDHVRELVHRLAMVKSEASTHKGLFDELERDRKAIQAELAEELEPGIVYHVDGYEVKRRRQTRETFNLTRARAAGVPETIISENTKLSEYDVWTVKRTVMADALDGQEDDDYGEVPF